MKFLRAMIAAAILTTLIPIESVAQDSQEYHPVLSDRFFFSVGGFWPQKSFKIQVDGTEPEEEIDFEEDLNLSDRETTWALNFRGAVESTQHGPFLALTATW